MEAELRTEY